MQRFIRNFLMGALALTLASTYAAAQSMDDLNIQFHGYATQGFIYTTNNNMLTTNSTDGSPAWTEAVINITATPSDKLRVAVQGRYFLLGNYGNAISLDYASADYKANDKFGIRFGKVKTPSGLFNETQDIDPSYVWALLPQSIYPITSRNSMLSHYGGVVYGTQRLGPYFGKLEYRGWGGEMALATDDGYLRGAEEGGTSVPNGVSSPVIGAALHWITPLPGLMLGASVDRLNHTYGVIANSAGVSGSLSLQPYKWEQYFAKYEKNRLMIAVEAEKASPRGGEYFPSIDVAKLSYHDYRNWYGMVTCKVTQKLTTGTYYTQESQHDAPLGPARHFNDWVISGRYDFNQFLYAKVEQHFVKGTLVDFDQATNQDGLLPTSKQTILKIGVNF